MRIAAASGDSVAGVKPAAFDQTQQHQTVRGLGADSVKEMPHPDVVRPRNLGGKSGGAGQQRARQGVTPRRIQYRARAARKGRRSPPRSSQAWMA